jgi:flagella basal body P-ring formation protein FlgA
MNKKNNKHTKIHKIVAVAFIAAAVLLSSFSAVFAADAKNPYPAKVSHAIISYLVDKYPEYAGHRIEVKFKDANRNFNELKYTQGDITFSVAELYPDFKPVGNIIVPIQVTVDGQDKQKMFFRTKISVYDKIVVAKKRLKHGDIITTDDASIEEMDVSLYGPDVIKDMNAVIGKELRMFVLQGNPIYERMIKEKPDVLKDEKVRIVASTESIQVESFGTAQENGKIGQEIKVKNVDSGKELIGVVSNTGEVTVK